MMKVPTPSDRNYTLVCAEPRILTAQVSTKAWAVPSAAGVFLDDDDLVGAVLLGEHGGEEADEAGAADNDAAAFDAVGQSGGGGSCGVGGGVQDSVGADRSEVRHVDPSRGLRSEGSRTTCSCTRSLTCQVACP